MGGGVASAHAAFILTPGDFGHPVPGVFEAPVAADGAGQLGGVRGQAAEVVAALAGGRGSDRALGFDGGDAAQGAPLGAVGQPVALVGAEVAARFDPAVIFLHRLMPAGLRQVFGMIQRVVEEGFDLLVEHFVVGFERKYVVASASWISRAMVFW